VERPRPSVRVVGDSETLRRLLIDADDDHICGRLCESSKREQQAQTRIFIDLVDRMGEAGDQPYEAQENA
jgi:hypothetical protein